jgi:hypothetical protein
MREELTPDKAAFTDRRGPPGLVGAGQEEDAERVANAFGHAERIAWFQGERRQKRCKLGREW